MTNTIRFRSLLLSAALCSFRFIYTAPMLDFRSQGVNLARDLSGWFTVMSTCYDAANGFIAITPEYSQSFNASSIATGLFGTSVNTSCSTPTLLVQGSLVPNRDSKAWLADYFGLPTDFNGTLFINPCVKTFLVDIEAYTGFDEFIKGAYASVHIPVVYTKWNLNISEQSTKGINNYPAGYFNAIPTDNEPPYRGANNDELLSKALDFLSGKETPDLGPDVYMQPLAYSKCVNSSDGQTGIADIRFTLGWNFICADDYHSGIHLHLSAPTGNKPSSNFLFSPVIGSGGHWKLGGGADFHLNLWRNVTETADFNFYVYGYAQHLFGTTQCRCFDLCGIQNSRYMLAQKLGSSRQNPPLAGPSNAGVEFQNEFAPVANLTRSYVNVSVALEGDLVVAFVYNNNNININVGYNYWGRTCDRIFLQNNCCSSPLEMAPWALKGDAQVIGFEEITNNPVRLAATESNATMNSGTNHFLIDSADRVNTKIDNPKEATTIDSEFIRDVLDLPNGQQTKSSKPPVIVSTANIGYTGTQGSSNKVFAHLDYAWGKHSHITGYLGIGGEIEFTSNDVCPNDCNQGCQTACDNGCNSPSNSCGSCALEQWGIWLKGGIAFY